MKRFLILFSLIAFVIVSCAEPNKVRLPRRGNDFRQDEFEKNCKECMENAKKEESYSQTSGVFDYCMFTKGYEYKPQATKWHSNPNYVGEGYVDNKGYRYYPQPNSPYIKKVKEDTGDENTAETVLQILMFTLLAPLAGLGHGAIKFK